MVVSSIDVHYGYALMGRGMVVVVNRGGGQEIGDRR